MNKKIDILERIHDEIVSDINETIKQLIRLKRKIQIAKEMQETKRRYKNK